MHLSLYLNADDAVLLEALAERFGVSAPSVGKLLLTSILHDDLAAAVLDGRVPKAMSHRRWGSHEVTELRRLRGERWSYSKIAERLGRPRSAVIGKAHRMGLSG